MNVLFIAHCDFTGNSGMHVFSIADALWRKCGLRSVVAVPHSAKSVREHGEPCFPVVQYDEAVRNGVLFAGGGGPHLIHAWTPREHVRNYTEAMVERYGCPYLVHLEDNESSITADDLAPFPYSSFFNLPSGVQDQVVPPHRTHPIRGNRFIAGSAGITALM